MPKLDDREMSRDAWAYQGPDKPLPVAETLAKQLKKDGIDIDAATGERRVSRKPTPARK